MEFWLFLDENDVIIKSIKSHTFKKKTTIKKVQPQPMHVETDAEKIQYAETKNLVFMLDMLVKIKTYDSLRKNYLAQSTTDKLKNFRWEFELLKDAFENRHLYWRPKKRSDAGHINLIDEALQLKRKHVSGQTQRSQLHSALNETSTSNLSNRDMEKIEVLNRWEKLKDETIDPETLLDTLNDIQSSKVSCEQENKNH